MPIKFGKERFDMNEETECRKAEIAHCASKLHLLEKYLEEKIRSNKVIEGVLRDIENDIGRIADLGQWFSEQQIKQKR